MDTAAFSGDSSSVLIAQETDEYTANIWDCSTGDCMHKLSGHSDIVRSAFFSGDSSSVLTASNDTTAKIWDCYTGECKQTLYDDSLRRYIASQHYMMYFCVGDIMLYDDAGNFAGYIVTDVVWSAKFS